MGLQMRTFDAVGDIFSWSGTSRAYGDGGLLFPHARHATVRQRMHPTAQNALSRMVSCGPARGGRVRSAGSMALRRRLTRRCVRNSSSRCGGLGRIWPWGRESHRLRDESMVVRNPVGWLTRTGITSTFRRYSNEKKRRIHTNNSQLPIKHPKHPYE